METTDTAKDRPTECCACSLLYQNLDEQRLDKLFLFYFFNTATVRKQIFLTSSGSKVRHTSPGKIRELSIALPSLDEQQDIVQLLRAVDAKLEVTERKRQSIADLFRTLLHQLMTAQIRVHRLDLDTQYVAVNVLKGTSNGS